ncbi:MAG: NAD(P)H-dependent oxidoreductase [Bacteriovoracaceae bacterium]
MDIIESLNWRYAVKEFDSSKKLDDPQIKTLEESLRLTPSSFGLQLWKFVIVSDQELKTKLKGASWNQGQIEQCSHLVVFTTPESVTDEMIDKLVNTTAQVRNAEVESLEGYAKVMKGFTGSQSPEVQLAWMQKQAYIALGSLMSLAALMGVDTCPMEGIVPDQYDEILGLKEQGLKTAVACCLGFRAETDKYATAAKVRYATEDVIQRK